MGFVDFYLNVFWQTNALCNISGPKACLCIKRGAYTHDIPLFAVNEASGSI